MGVKYSVNEDFFKEWTPKMAYVLGYLYADGSLEDASYLRGKYVRVSSIERENIAEIKKLLKSEHTIVEIKPTTKNRKIRYLLRIGSHTLYNDLTNIGLYPNKSLTVKFPYVPQKFLSHYVRGYFDGDGCVMIQKAKGKRKKIIIKKLNVVFTCGSKIFLEKLAKKLHDILNIHQLNVYNGHKSFMLSYSTKDSVKFFKFIYNDVGEDFFIKRKFKVFYKYFKLRPQRIDNEIKKIIRQNVAVW